MAEIDKGLFYSVKDAIEAIMKNHPKILSYTDAWWGDKQTSSGNMSNRGYVIGFKDIASRAQWRLDYDPVPTKGVHINWTQDFKDSETLKECYRIQSHVFQKDELVWEYYRGWTRTRHEQIPPAIKQRLDGNGRTSWNGSIWQRV